MEDVAAASREFYFAAKPNILNIERGALDPPNVMVPGYPCSDWLSSKIK
jgi:hypothetical protein